MVNKDLYGLTANSHIAQHEFKRKRAQTTGVTITLSMHTACPADTFTEILIMLSFRSVTLGTWYLCKDLQYHASYLKHGIVRYQILVRITERSMCSVFFLKFG